MLDLSAENVCFSPRFCVYTWLCVCCAVPVGTCRKRTAPRWQTSTANTSTSRPNCDCWKSSSANETAASSSEDRLKLETLRLGGALLPLGLGPCRHCCSCLRLGETSWLISSCPPQRALPVEPPPLIQHDSFSSLQRFLCSQTSPFTGPPFIPVTEQRRTQIVTTITLTVTHLCCYFFFLSLSYFSEQKFFFSNFAIEVLKKPTLVKIDMIAI